MATIIDQMTEIYVFTDDYLKAHPVLAAWRRSHNAQPEFTDAEVITLAEMQGCLGVDTLKKTYDLIAENYRSAFPKLCSYQQWIARLHQLSPVVGHLMRAAHKGDGEPLRLYIFDSKPIPMCKAIRHGRVRLLREDGAYFGKNRAGWFFGFKLHVLININGRVASLVFTPGNWDDRDPALALGLSVDGGIALGDLGYRSKRLAADLAEETELLLITPADAGDRRALISSVREGVETFLSKLWRGFIDRIFSRSWQGLWNTILLKLLNYNLRHAGILSA